MEALLLQKSLTGVADVLAILRGASLATESVAVLSTNPLYLPQLDKVASHAADLVKDHVKMSGVDNRKADIEIAEQLHKALDPIRTDAPWVLHMGRFWEWLAVDPFKDYAMNRWCGGREAIGTGTTQFDELPQESRLGRFILLPANVKSHSRHVVRRLYILADCSISCSNTYAEIDDLLPSDTDIPSAIFERKIGLSPKLALVLSRIAVGFLPTAKSSGMEAVSARSKRRDFFKQVNLMMSTIAVENLDENMLMAYFSKVATEIG